jgi:hypothetical protein
MAMNESTLNALINLFAVFSVKGGKHYDDAKKNLEEYLTNRLGIKTPDEYLSLFFEIYDLYNSGLHDLNDDNTKVIAGKICNQIKSRINHSEQLMIFLHFLELAKRDVNSLEHQLYDLVAEIFEIRTHDYIAFKQFIFSDDPSSINSGGFLLINREAGPHGKNIRHILKESLSGHILIYYIGETDQFILKYFGE